MSGQEAISGHPCFIRLMRRPDAMLGILRGAGPLEWHCPAIWPFFPSKNYLLLGGADPEDGIKELAEMRKLAMQGIQ